MENVTRRGWSTGRHSGKMSSVGLLLRQTRQPTACRLLGTNLETALLLACPHCNRSDKGPEHRGTLRERCSGVGDLDGGMDD